MMTLLTATLVLALAPAGAPSAETTETGSASDSDGSSDTAALARALFERGLLAYEAGDYAGATTHWTSAHDLMASEPSLTKSRRVLAFDLGQAQMRAYDVDGDRSRLTRARPLLEDYVAWVDRPGHTLSNDEREDRARAMEMLARIDILEGAPPSPRGRPVAPAPTLADAPPPPPRQRNGTGLIVAGAVSLGVGTALAATAVAFSVRAREAKDDYQRAEEELARDPGNPLFTTNRDRAEFEGTQANAGLVATATLSALMGAGGIAMLAIGAKMRRRARNVAAAPALAPGFAGATVHVRF